MRKARRISRFSPTGQLLGISLLLLTVGLAALLKAVQFQLDRTPEESSMKAAAPQLGRS
jgi:hypothetical protein